MASRLQLNRPRDGMNFIWNVSQHAGDHTSCANLPTDFELVSIIMAEVTSRMNGLMIRNKRIAKVENMMTTPPNFFLGWF